jgi:hypothetical protein
MSGRIAVPGREARYKNWRCSPVTRPVKIPVVMRLKANVIRGNHSQVVVSFEHQ